MCSAGNKAERTIDRHDVPKLKVLVFSTRTRTELEYGKQSNFT